MVNKISLVLLLIAFATTLTAQNIGIGITAPLGKLHIKGASDVSQLIIEANSTQSNTSPLFKLRNSLGNDLLWLHADDTSNIFLGLHAGGFNSISGGGAYNTFVGSNAGKSNTTGPFNTAIGAGSFLSNSTGANNTAIGLVSLFSNSSGINNTASGSYSLSSNSTGSENTASGYGSLFSNTSGDYNTAMGVNTLFSNVTGSRATAIGYNAMQYSNNTGDAFTNYNVAVGYEALRGSTDPAANLGNDNTALGYQTLRSNTTGEANTASGSGALFYNTTGLANTATGTYSLNNNTTGNNNTAIGYRALEASIAGDYNTATGSDALSYNNTGMWNTGIGSNALHFNVEGSANVALGNAALLNNTYGSSNTANGTDALFANLTGSNNTAIGKEALYTNLTGSNNTAIGYKANVAADDIVNATAIGSNAYAGTSNTVVIGSINGVNGATANANVGIGTSTPNAKLHVNGTLKVVDGTQGAGKILTSDVAGLASWQPPPPPPGTNDPSVSICCQRWMTKNLDVSTYRNGDAIPKVTDNAAWTALTTGAYCYYNNDSTTYAATYGKLYNWYAVNDPRGLAPEGWYIPTDFEWTTLGNCFGGNIEAGGPMKEPGTTHWSSPNTGANNKSGFTGLPGGERETSGLFYSIGTGGYWWSATVDASSTAWGRALYYNQSNIVLVIDGMHSGFSVRCIRD